MEFEVVGRIRAVETIAEGRGIRDLVRLRPEFGPAAWRRCKGTAVVRWSDGTLGLAEIHWYEAHGIGKRRFKVKQFLD